MCPIDAEGSRPGTRSRHLWLCVVLELHCGLFRSFSPLCLIALLAAQDEIMRQATSPFWPPPHVIGNCTDRPALSMQQDAISAENRPENLIAVASFARAAHLPSLGRQLRQMPSSRTISSGLWAHHPPCHLQRPKPLAPRTQHRAQRDRRSPSTSWCRPKCGWLPSPVRTRRTSPATVLATFTAVELAP